MSATIFNSKRLELIPLQYLILDDPYPYEKCFKSDGGIIDDWEEKIMVRFNGYVFYSGLPDSKHTPAQVFVGNQLQVHANGRVYSIDNERKYCGIGMTKDMIEYDSKVQHMQFDALLFLLKIDGDFIYNKDTIRKFIKTKKYKLTAAGLFVDINTSGRS